MKISDKVVLFLLIMTASMSSCGEYEQLEHKKRLIIQADSLFATQRDSLRKQYDTLCDLNHEAYYNASLDSIKAKQIKEIKDLIDN